MTGYGEEADRQEEMMQHPGWLLIIVGLVVAGIGCLSIPYGAILGVMTFIVLLRKSVKAMFSETPEDQAEVPVVS